MQPTLRQLEYAVAIADRRSFHAAAKACHVSQPGLSDQIRTLEELLDARLFERSRRGVLPTPAGVEIVRRARGILAEVAHLEQAARVLNKPFSGPLRLGVIPTIAPYLLPRVMQAARRRYPELRMRLHEARTAELVEMLQRGELDLLLVALEAPLDGLTTVPLFRDPFVVATPRAHPLARRKRIRQEELRTEQVLLLADGHCLREQVLSVCESAGADELGDFGASSLATLVQMVVNADGITLLPSLALPVEARARDLALVQLAKPVPARTIGLAWRPTSPRAEEFRALGEMLVPAESRRRSGQRERKA